MEEDSSVDNKLYILQCNLQQRDDNVQKELQNNCANISDVIKKEVVLEEIQLSSSDTSLVIKEEFDVDIIKKEVVLEETQLNSSDTSLVVKDEFHVDELNQDTLSKTVDILLCKSVSPPLAVSTIVKKEVTVETSESTLAGAGDIAIAGEGIFFEEPDHEQFIDEVSELKMDQDCQFDDKLKQKRELANVRMKKQRKKKQEEAEKKQNLVSKDVPKEQFQQNKLKRKRELANARLKKYRQRKREEAQQQKLVSQDVPNEQILQNKLKRKRELSKERSRRYRDRKRLCIIKSAEHAISITGNVVHK